MKINLIIDGNYLMQKSVFILFKLRTLYTDLPVILERDYYNLSNLFYFNKIFFISDSRKNWRKDLYEDYKSTRKKNDSIDWEEVYKIFNKFKYSLNDKNCYKYQIDGLEADDIISYIVKKTNANGESNLIISSDSDLFQLLHYDTMVKYMNFMFNFKFNDERIFIPKSYQLFIDEIDDMSVDDMFGGGSNDNTEFKEFLMGMIKNKKVTEVDSELELFTKIIGHNKDNIKSIYMKGTRGIGKAGSEKIYNFYKETYPDVIDFNSDDFKERLIEIVKYQKRVKDIEKEKEMQDKLKLNLKLVKLDKKSTPDYLYEKMIDEIEL